MNKTLTLPYNRLKEISSQLQKFDCKQSSLVLLENLFFEALSLSRNYADEPGQSTLTYELMQMKENEYKRTQEYGKTIKTQESLIRNFRHKFKKVVDKSIVA